MASSIKTKAATELTPAMRQYQDAKQSHSDAILFFRMGDFYEMFYEDALTASRVLEITLTSRSKDSAGNPIPMCGIPHHASTAYITKLVKRGYRVAICEQISDSQKSKKKSTSKAPLPREVVRVVSPGTLTDDDYLDEREKTFIASLSVQPGKHPRIDKKDGGKHMLYGVSLVDLSTGEFTASEFTRNSGRQTVLDELSILAPKEIIQSDRFVIRDDLPELSSLQTQFTKIDAHHFTDDQAHSLLCEHLEVPSLNGSSLYGHPAAISACGALVHYLTNTQKVELNHLRSISFQMHVDHVLIDSTTFRHLEILSSTDGDKKRSLLAELDSTRTPMGARLLRSWLQRPLNKKELIQNRLDAVEELAFLTMERLKLKDVLSSVHDLERLTARIVLGSASPRDLVALARSIRMIPEIKQLLQECKSPLLISLLAELDELRDVRENIDQTLVDEPPLLIRDGGAIRGGLNTELDDCRALSTNAKDSISVMETTEKERTGISSLKIRYNRVFGYFIEISKSNLHLIPDDYHRKQTIANGERFITPELKAYESKALTAEERSLELESMIFETLKSDTSQESARIQQSAKAIAALDVLRSLSDAATTLNYTKPHIHEEFALDITEGRHPVVERHAADSFVPNDVSFDEESQQLLIITGPNMGGKSTFLRQTALITLLAHIGSFVPAKQSKIPIIDKLFARVGASDSITTGQSTFMLEMQETARILKTASSRSLVLLDEIGRGTATFDGLSLAWAVAEHLSTDSRARPKTMFATHYHELTDLAEAIPTISNFHVLAREWNDEIVFLRRIERGRSDLSYGIQVARLAGLPLETLKRAKEILTGLETDELSRGARSSFSDIPPDSNAQPGLFQSTPVGQQALERIRRTNLDRLTPLEALTLLAEIKDEITDTD
ncbi:DNA mismatch repair protein MutS [Myxococcota bacterium]|nr:DNA mismatch repair protein MutS [Myxococcota bacterium]